VLAEESRGALRAETGREARWGVGDLVGHPLRTTSTRDGEIWVLGRIEASLALNWSERAIGLEYGEQSVRHCSPPLCGEPVSTWLNEAEEFERALGRTT
jgi:hypothetical protein